MPIIITIQVPALDRLVDYLTANEQKAVDALAAQVRSTITDPLHTSGSALESATTPK